MTTERRFVTQAPGVETRVEGEARTVVGYAAVFNRPTNRLYGFREQMAPGAFAASLGGDVVALFNHDVNHVLGRTTSGTLRLAEDETGLRAEIDLPPCAMGESVFTAISRRDVTGMSIGFRTVAEEWRQEDDGTELRTIIEAELIDAGPVALPAYADTSVAVRSREAWRAERQGFATEQMRLRLRIAEAE